MSKPPNFDNFTDKQLLQGREGLINAVVAIDDELHKRAGGKDAS